MASDERPAVWVGHIAIGAADVKRSSDYWVGLGMRPIVTRDGLAVLELRGGTHLVILPAESPIEPGTPAPFDLMVDDIEATHLRYDEMGLGPSQLQVGQIHTSFKITDPSGYEITVNSTHVSDQPV